VAAPQPREVDAAEALDVLDVLGDPQRRRILVRLSAGAVCTCNDLVAATGVAQPTVSHHLKVLREAGLIVGERCGRYVNYRVVPARLRRLSESFAKLAAAAESDLACAPTGPATR